MEHLAVILRHDGAVADGVVLGVEDGDAFRLRYTVHCDPRWRVRRVEVSFVAGGRGLSLTADGEGRWFDRSGAAVPALDGCVDLDITATPLTNTLPIRRLALRQGESAAIRVAYVTIPDLRVAPDEQRYTRLETGAAGGRYRFEQVGSGFTAVLQVDGDGLVEDYPGLFKRVWAGDDEG
ncbi:MAG: putative glycolipid-binding domain-containing protein [Acidobacteriota bacterium]|nr:putative glycolipid-binding domain-containing protein [Acidobacteriota bacterium]